MRQVHLIHQNTNFQGQGARSRQLQEPDQVQEILVRHSHQLKANCLLGGHRQQEDPGDGRQQGTPHFVRTRNKEKRRCGEEPVQPIAHSIPCEELIQVCIGSHPY